MNHRVELPGLHQGPHRLAVPSVALMKISLSGNRPAVPAVEVIHHRHLVSGCDQLPGSMGADVTGTTGNQYR